MSGLFKGKIEMAGVKQRGIHDMQWEFEQPCRGERLEDLSGSRTISHGFIVSNRGVVNESCIFERYGSLTVIVQPVHPHPNFLGSRNSSNLLPFLSADGGIIPRINSMQPDFPASRNKSLKMDR